MSREAAAEATIVVGVDGSDNAERALRWAIEEARLRTAALRIVTAWHVPLAVYASHGGAPPASVSLEDEIRRTAEAIAETAARRAREESGLVVETTVAEGHAADVLIDEAKEADLLVVGAGSHRSRSGLLTNSVSVQCALEAPSPTTVVH